MCGSWQQAHAQVLLATDVCLGAVCLHTSSGLQPHAAGYNTLVNALVKGYMQQEIISASCSVRCRRAAVPFTLPPQAKRLGRVLEALEAPVLFVEAGAQAGARNPKPCLTFTAPAGQAPGPRAGGVGGAVPVCGGGRAGGRQKP